MKILVVEDDDVVATLLQHIFKRQGYEITHIPDGREAVRTIAAGDPPDAVVLDYMLPFVSGLEVLKEIRRTDAWKDVPVIFLTARSAQTDIAEVLDAGADDYMTKPFGVEELGARVRRLVGR